MVKERGTRKRGRKSAQEVQDQVIHALKHLQEFGILEESPLGRLPVLRQLAEDRYRMAIFPTAFALRAALLDAVNAVLRDLDGIPGYHREMIFIREFVHGHSVAHISRQMKLSREHVASTALS